MHTLPLLHLSCIEFCTLSFLLASFSEQISEDGIGNTEHSNVNVNAECNGNNFFALMPTHVKSHGESGLLYTLRLKTPRGSTDLCSEIVA